MPHRILDILASLTLLGSFALIEKHHLLFASIASICTIVYWIYRFTNWIFKKIIKDAWIW